MKLKMLPLALLVVSVSTQSGPLGIDMGDLPNDKKFKDFSKMAGEGNYLIGTNPPRAHSSFNNYVIRFASTEGACWIKAIGKEIESDKFGVRTKSVIDKISGQIRNKYGEYELTDRLSYGATWDEAKYWMMSIKENERVYMYEWSKQSDSNISNTNIQKIYLYADAVGSGDGRPVIEFYFNNYSICEKEKDQLEEDAF